MRTNAASSVKDGRYYLQLAGAEARERLLLAAAALWNVPVAELTAKDSVITHAPSGRTTTYGRIARSRRADAASAPGDDHHQAARPVDADGHRAEEPRRAAQGDRADRLRHRRPAAGHEVGGREGVPGLRRRRQALRLRRRSAACRACGPRCSSRFPIRRCTRGRIFSGGVAVIADTWYQAKTALDRMPIEWDDSAGARRVQQREHARRAARARSTGPARVRVDQGDVDAGFARRREDRRGHLLDAVPAARAHGARQRHGARRPTTAWTSGSAIRARRRRASAPSKITGIPETERPPAPVPPRRRLRPQRQRARRPSTRS